MRTGLLIAKSVYPEGWDAQRSDKSFNEWQNYIHSEVRKFSQPQHRERLQDARGQAKVLLQAKQILK